MNINHQDKFILIYIHYRGAVNQLPSQSLSQIKSGLVNQTPTSQVNLLNQVLFQPFDCILRYQIVFFSLRHLLVVNQESHPVYEVLMKYHMKQQKELIGQLVGENSEIF
jgi:hypothetical protein